MYLVRPASGFTKPAQNPKSALSGPPPASCEGNAGGNSVTNPTYIDGFNEAAMLCFEVVARLDNSPYRHDARGFASFQVDALKMRDSAWARIRGGRRS